MNYIKVDKCSISNGVGFRTVLWVSGCNHYCKNCQNPQTWDKEKGTLFNIHTWNEILNNLKNSYISGITFSGGDPLFLKNRDTITNISKKLKELYPYKTQWLYTGYNFEEIKDLEIMKYLDVLVDGKYIDNQRDITLKWRGSKNQRVIDVPKSLNSNKVILYCK